MQNAQRCCKQLIKISFALKLDGLLCCAPKSRKCKCIICAFKLIKLRMNVSIKMLVWENRISKQLRKCTMIKYNLKTDCKLAKTFHISPTPLFHSLYQLLRFSPQPLALPIHYTCHCIHTSVCRHIDLWHYKRQ